MIPKKQSLTNQVVEIIREQVSQGVWREWLPGERQLCAMLQVSRITLRRAMLQLRREGRMESVQGIGTRIVATGKAPQLRRRSDDVAILMPDAIERLRPSQTVWVDDLRGLLGERGVRLRLFHGPQYFRRNCDAALKKLVRQNAHGCWVLALSNEQIQRWFELNRVPCVILGTTYAKVDLPYRDLDHRAICRHAAGVLLSLGHRKFALLTTKERRAGDIESELGFNEGARQSSKPDVQANIYYHEGTPVGVCHAIDRLLATARRPTALLVVNTSHYLTVTTRLMQLGYQIPRDFSVISRDDDAFLSAVMPAPSRYMVDPHRLAKALVVPVLELLESGAVSRRTLSLMPEFMPNKSIGPPPMPTTKSPSGRKEASGSQEFRLRRSDA